jgi:4-hydroxybenzoate polyprenyltransferase
MRSAGCIINDLTDIEVDKQVARTASRPLAAGTLSKNDAYEMLLVMLLIALGCFILLPIKAQLIALLSLVPVAIYPHTKKFMKLPQVFLGLTFNLGVLVCWFTFYNHFSIVPITLYLGAAFWTIGFDTIYALQDKKDDLKIGVNSSAITLGKNVKKFTMQLYTCSIGMLMVFGINTNMNIIYYLFILSGFYLLYWQCEELDEENPTDIMTKFKSNAALGIIVFLGIIFGRI